MSKGSFILQGTTGKVGTLVVQRRKGKTILKEYVIPSNPKTASQIAQRIIFATVQQAAKFMKPIVDHSFEGVSRGADTLNRFAKVNLERMRAYSALDFAQKPSYAEARCFMTTKGISALIPNKYIMAQGSLVLNPVSNNRIDTVGGVKVVYPFSNANEVNVTYSGTTLGDVLKALFGFTQAGQQLTKCFIICRSGVTYDIYEYGGVPTVPGTVIPSFKFLAVRLVVSETANLSQVVTEMNETALKTAIMGAFDIEKSDSTLKTLISNAISFEQGIVSLNFAEDIVTAYQLGGFTAAECTILSQMYGADWLRSNAEMSLVDVPSPDNNYGLTWYEAQKAWVEKSNNADTERFLNEGGESNQVGF